MKILFPTLGSYGDVYPLLSLGKNLQLRGHEVFIVANPLFQEIVIKAGLAFLPLGSEKDYYDEINNPDIWHPTRGFQLVVEHGILRMLRPLYEIIRQFDPADTMIVSSAFLFGSHIAHETHGYRFCTFHLQPSLIRSVFAPPVLSNPALPEWAPAWMVKGFTRVWIGSLLIHYWHRLISFVKNWDCHASLVFLSNGFTHPSLTWDYFRSGLLHRSEIGQKIPI